MSDGSFPTHISRLKCCLKKEVETPNLPPNACIKSSKTLMRIWLSPSKVFSVAIAVTVDTKNHIIIR